MTVKLHHNSALEKELHNLGLRVLGFLKYPRMCEEALLLRTVLTGMWECGVAILA